MVDKLEVGSHEEAGYQRVELAYEVATLVVEHASVVAPAALVAVLVLAHVEETMVVVWEELVLVEVSGQCEVSVLEE